MRATEDHRGAREVNKAFVTLKDAQAYEAMQQREIHDKQKSTPPKLKQWMTHTSSWAPTSLHAAVHRMVQHTIQPNMQKAWLTHDSVLDSTAMYVDPAAITL